MRNEYVLYGVWVLCAGWMLVDWLRGVFWARNFEARSRARDLKKGSENA